MDDHGLHVISPSFTPISSSNTSICYRATEFGKIVQLLNLNTVIVSNIEDYSNQYKSKPIGKRVIVDCRPGDIIQREADIGKFEMVIMLIHQQDVCQMTDADWNKLSEIIRVNNATVCGVTAYARNVLKEKKVPNVNDYIIRIPIKQYPDNISVELVCKTLSEMTTPQVALWSMPAIRKNSYMGALGLIEACNLYNAPVVVKAINSIYSSQIDALFNYFKVGKVVVEKTDNPSDHVLHYILSTSTSLILASYDEGLNLPLYEAGRLGTDIITSGIGVHKEGAKIYSNVHPCGMYSTEDTGEVFGHLYDEIYAEIKLPVLDYASFVRHIHSSIVNWKKTRDRMLKIFQSNKHNLQPWTVNLDMVSNILKIGKRKKPGKAELRIL